MKISVIGAGYVGLVTAFCFAEIGHDVICIDNDSTKIQALLAGKLPIYEPGLQEIFEKVRGRILFSASSASAVLADVIFICVGTPPLPNGAADLSAIDRVAKMIATEAKAPKLIVEKSTVPAQTGQELKRALSVYSRNKDLFRVASNPEFLREGTAVRDFLHPDRIVVGVEDELSEAMLFEIYLPILRSNPKTYWLVTSINSAELIKHASNSFLAMKISYANMVSDLAEHIGADSEEVLRAVGLDPRIGSSFLQPGLGFGGFCLPKDLQAFIHLANKHGVDFNLLKEVEKINKKRIDYFIDKIEDTLWVVKDKKIAILGETFKSNTDDIRFSPSIDLSMKLTSYGAIVERFDPALKYLSESPYHAAKDAEALIIATDWPEFKQLDWERIRDSMARPLVLDGRNLLDPQDMKDLGFEYYSVGRL